MKKETSCWRVKFENLLIDLIQVLSLIISSEQNNMKKNPKFKRRAKNQPNVENSTFKNQRTNELKKRETETYWTV